MEGSLPERWLLETIKNLSKVREVKDRGIEPERLLFDTSRMYNDGILSQKLGISPDNRLLERTMVVNWLRLPMDRGMLPFKEFREMSRSVREGITSLMSRGIGPEKRLSLRYNMVMFDDQSGRGPSKRQTINEISNLTSKFVDRKIHRLQAA
ncbi:hypothetical protein ACFX12_023349 [Malus domestica]